MNVEGLADRRTWYKCFGRIHQNSRTMDGAALALARGEYRRRIDELQNTKQSRIPSNNKLL